MSQLTWQTIKSVQDAPTTCGVYEYWTGLPAGASAKEGHTLLYIGKAINIKARLLSHAQNARMDAKEAAIVAGTTIRYTLCDTEFKALLLESQLIQKYHPPHNRAWKDDKSYLYILINLSDPFPRPSFARAHEISDPNSTKKLRIFGPFPSARIAEEVLRAIRRLIPFCMAKRVGKHACFYSRIGLCSPCPANILKTTSLVERAHLKRQYRLQIRHVVRILEGNIEPVIKELTKEMQTASKREDFEGALAIRTAIERFERFITSHSFTDRHFSYNNSEEKLAALCSLLSPLSPALPALHRIECYDASNNAMKNSVVSLTVMTDGLLDKGQYRRFKIKNPRAVSDFDRLDEALTRRLKNKAWDKADLVVIDGGVPQLRRLQRIFDQQTESIFYLGLAKHPDRLIIPTVHGEFETFRVSSDHLGLQLLEQLRDEAHRFANAYRHILERKNKL